MTSALRRADRYLDAVAALSADPVDVGPLRAFVSRAPWPYYVRPRPDLDLSGDDAVSARDVRAAAQVLRDAGHPAAFEWVEDLVPCLAPLLRAQGVEVAAYPLLARPLVDGTPLMSSAARVLGPDDLAVPAVLAVQAVGFDSPGTAVGPAGVLDRDEQALDVQLEAHVREGLRRGDSTLAVLEDGERGVVACGWHLPVGSDTEVVGVATLPSHRRHGAAAAVLDALLADAVARGVTFALLAASDADVARIYERAGFARIGIACAATLP